MTDRPISAHSLNDGDVTVTLLSLGAIVQDWQVPVGDGTRRSVVLGYRDPESYRRNPAFFGALVGRVANRIAGAKFTLDGQSFALDANEAPHHLHGGATGLGLQFWSMDPDGARCVRLRCHSPDGAGGYPGHVNVVVDVTLTGHRLRFDMTARPDRPTPISLAQHSYYALQDGPIWDQVLHLPADGYTPVGPDLIPTGEIAPVTSQHFDFNTPRPLALADPARQGIDLNYVRPLDTRPAAVLRAPNGMELRMDTDQPGIQLFTAPNLRPGAAPLPGQSHLPFHALCLEPQGLPNAVNTPGFPGVIATPERPYRQVLDITIQAGQAG